MVRLDDEEKGIVRYLGTYDDAVNFLDITKYLKEQGYEHTSLKDVREDLDHLIKTGYVRSKTEGKGSKRDERFYLAKLIGGGGRKKKELQGRGVLRDLGKLIERLSGAFFLLFGFGVIIYEGIGFTGSVVSENVGGGLTFIFAFVLVIIGGILLKKSFRKPRK